MIHLTKSDFEVLDLLQEECAEIIQIASKIKRFGPLSSHPNNPEETNMVTLSKEIGDVQAFIEIIRHRSLGLVDEVIEEQKANKLERFKKFLTVE